MRRRGRGREEGEERGGRGERRERREEGEGRKYLMCYSCLWHSGISGVVVRRLNIYNNQIFFLKEKEKYKEDEKR